MQKIVALTRSNLLSALMLKNKMHSPRYVVTCCRVQMAWLLAPGSSVAVLHVGCIGGSWQSGFVHSPWHAART